MKMVNLIAAVVYVLFLIVVFLTFYATDRRMVALFVVVGSAVLAVVLRWIRG
ncbi:hypothetical protein [Olsenella sp. Marseille-P4559]|uniref:hypothetical protein n=1 Tax=Olsenella sp. Marseille-P4559 TaxID=2364795 RepID=UPI0013EF2CDA|nr:hypothetical protein [Olsenella sp. Marseille-P4559]